MHRTYPILGGLALGLVLLAASAPAEASAEYSGATLPGLALPHPAESSSPVFGKVRTAQNAGAPSDGDAAAAEARNRLKKELDRMRRAKDGAPEPQPAAPKPAKKKEPPATNAAEARPPKPPAPKPPATAAAEAPRPPKPPARAIDPAIDRLAGKLIIMRFSGNHPTDGGPKAIRALLHDGLIAGAMFGTENIQSKGQLKELMKFLWQPGPEPKPIFAIQEIGGSGDGLPRTKEFESWPSEQQVASKGPEYAYSTYRSLGSYLAGLGFTLNFGPMLGADAAARNPSASFGANPLQAGVFAKTFLLGHSDDKMVTVPVVDSSDAAVRALKTLLVSHPALPVAVSDLGEAQPFAVYEGLVKGPRFCFVSVAQKGDYAHAAVSFSRGCDVLVLHPGKDSPAAVRDAVAQSLADAIKQGSLSAASLEAGVQRLKELRQGLSPSSDGFATRTAQ
jgi:hypothetical protein